MRTRLFSIVLLFVPLILSAHGGHKHVMGTVVSVSSESLVVTTSKGDVSVPLSSDTKYYRGSSTRQGASRDDVSNGMRVVIHVAPDGKAIEVHIPEATTS
jgi:hypothetical protein